MSFQNSGLRSNIVRTPPAAIPSDLAGDIIQIQFPTRAVKAVDLAHMPASVVKEGYTANTKTMVQNMFNSKNLNENLNYKNTFYATERGNLANKEANTIYGHEKVYPKQVVDGDLKAEYAAKTWKDSHIKGEKKVKDALRETTENVSKIRENEARIEADEQAKHEKEVKKYFKKVQNLIGVMTGTISPKATIRGSISPKDEKFPKALDEDDSDRIGAHHIQRETNDEETILNNRANIRTLMGARSNENQEKLQAEREAREREAAMEAEQKLKAERQEEKRISKFLDLKKLSKSWRIPDKTKLKEVVRNEIMKDIMKEEERKNFEKIAQHMKKQPEKSLIKKPAKPKIEPPKAYSPSKKKQQQKKKESKKYTFSPEKIQKLPHETVADYRTRFNFTVMALPQQKETLDPVEQHLITKKFQEMIVKNGVERNGKVVLEARK